MTKRRKRSDDAEEYCEDCGELLEDCECEEEDELTLADIGKGLDVLGKGLDVLGKWKKLTTQPEPRFGPVKDELSSVAHDTQRKLKETPEEIAKIKNEKSEKEGKKWKTEIRIAIISGIVIPIVIALIGFLTGFFK